MNQLRMLADYCTRPDYSWIRMWGAFTVGYIAAGTLVWWTFVLVVIGVHIAAQAVGDVIRWLARLPDPALSDIPLPK